MFTINEKSGNKAIFTIKDIVVQKEQVIVYVFEMHPKIFALLTSFYIVFDQKKLAICLCCL